MTTTPIAPFDRTIVASHTNLQVVCDTARAALAAWTRAAARHPGPDRMRPFLEVVHAHDLVARCGHDRAQTWRRRLAQAIQLEQGRPGVAAAVKAARDQAARLAR